MQPRGYAQVTFQTYVETGDFAVELGRGFVGTFRKHDWRQLACPQAVVQSVGLKGTVDQMEIGAEVFEKLRHAAPFLVLNR